MATDAHVPTPQETEIYQALGAGDHDTIEELHDTAAADGPDELEQFGVDYSFAWNHYQADHEMPEEQREQETAEEVGDENRAAVE